MPKWWRWLALIAAAAIVALVVQFVLPRSYILHPPRAANGTSYLLYVHVPDACRNGGCPALYLLDGLAWLPTFARTQDQLVTEGRMSPVIIVGIGYSDILHTADLRKHDFTPAFGREPGATGGAETFLDVLHREIIPYAEAHLPIARDSRGLAGHSYAGLFAAYALQRAPDLFDRYLIMSPALWFDGGKIFDQPFAPPVGQRSVFLAADTPHGAQSHMARDVLRLNDLLTQQPGLTVSRALIVDKTHNSMVGPAALRGLRALYAFDAEGP